MGQSFVVFIYTGKAGVGGGAKTWNNLITSSLRASILKNVTLSYFIILKSYFIKKLLYPILSSQKVTLAMKCQKGLRYDISILQC